MQTNILHLNFHVRIRFSEIIDHRKIRKWFPENFDCSKFYLCLNHKTATHSHFINHSKYIHIWFIFIILKKFINSNKCSSSPNTCRAMNYCWAHCWKSVHLMTNLSNEPNEGVQWRWYSIIGPHSKMELKDKLGFRIDLSKLFQGGKIKKMGHVNYVTIYDSFIIKLRLSIYVYWRVN